MEEQGHPSFIGKMRSILLFKPLSAEPEARLDGEGFGERSMKSEASTLALHLRPRQKLGFSTDKTCLASTIPEDMPSPDNT